MALARLGIHPDLRALAHRPTLPRVPRAEEYLAEMARGPGTPRFVLQPLVAIALGILHGLRDQRAGRQPLLLEVFSLGDHLRRLTDMLRDILVPLGIAMLASVVFQYVIRSRVHLVFALAYAGV